MAGPGRRAAAGRPRARPGRRTPGRTRGPRCTSPGPPRRRTPGPVRARHLGAQAPEIRCKAQQAGPGLEGDLVGVAHQPSAVHGFASRGHGGGGGHRTGSLHGFCFQRGRVRPQSTTGHPGPTGGSFGPRAGRRGATGTTPHGTGITPARKAPCRRPAVAASAHGEASAPSHAGGTRSGGGDTVSVSTRIAAIAVGDPSRRAAGVGREVSARLRERVPGRPLPPGTRSSGTGLPRHTGPPTWPRHVRTGRAPPASRGSGLRGARLPAASPRPQWVLPATISTPREPDVHQGQVCQVVSVRERPPGRCPQIRGSGSVGVRGACAPVSAS